jgi:hypothetical protein
VATQNVFVQDFKRLLERFPDESSLAEWQYAYRQVIYLMGLDILTRFPNDAVGPDPTGASGAAGGGAGSGRQPTADDKGGGHPSLCSLACLVLSLPSD